jgi:pimeloyl-ACP methyl ester carboxylesterase
MGHRADDFTLSPASGVRLAGTEEGEGAPIVLLHGLTATRRYVVHGSRMLARSGHRVLAYDARGHGESSPAPRRDAYEYSDLVCDLRALLHELASERVVLVGSSMGAATAMALALAEPERVAALVQVTPAYDGAPRDGSPREGAPQHDGESREPHRGEPTTWPQLADDLDAGDIDAFVEHVGVRAVPERYREPAELALRQRLGRHRDPHAVADALRVVPYSRAFDGLEALADLDLPVLVVASRDEADPGHPLALARDYARLLPRSRLLVEEEGESPLAWRGAQLSRAIADFLAES